MQRIQKCNRIFWRVRLSLCVMQECKRMHLATKNTTIRLDKEMIKEVDKRCKKQTCTRNDYIKNAIDNQLEMDASIEDEANTPRPDRNPTPKPQRVFLDNIPEKKPQVVFVDGDPRDYKIIKAEPKPTSQIIYIDD